MDLTEDCLVWLRFTGFNKYNITMIEGGCYALNILLSEVITMVMTLYAPFLSLSHDADVALGKLSCCH